MFDNSKTYLILDPEPEVGPLFPYVVHDADSYSITFHLHEIAAYVPN